MAAKKPTKAKKPVITPEAAKEAKLGEEEALDNEANVAGEGEDEPKLENKAGEDVEEAVSADPVDYLRQYQYRKQTKLGSIDSDPPVGSKAAKMKAFMLTQPKVRMIIPLKEGEDPNVRLSVNLNGYRLDYPRNTYINVPENVADVLMDSLKQTTAALERNLISGKDKEDALL